jgi:hypothetical protein
MERAFPIPQGRQYQTLPTPDGRRRRRRSNLTKTTRPENSDSDDDSLEEDTAEEGDTFQLVTLCNGLPRTKPLVESIAW